MHNKTIIIDDFHSALKIVKTLPQIEFYQKDQMPSSKAAEAVANAAYKVIAKEKVLLKK